MTLLLHCGAARCSRADLEAVEVPPPTQTWHPVAHTTVLDTVLSKLDQLGLEPCRQELAMTHEGARFFATLDLEMAVANGVNLSIGIRNSIDRSISAGLAVGERVFVCDNLCFSAEIVVMRKHTRFILRDLDAKVSEGLSQLSAYQEVAAARIEGLRQYRLNEPAVHDLVVRAADERCISWSGIGNVLQQWREPQHDQFLPRNAWSLMNAFTEVLKARFERNPVEASGRTIRLTSLFTAACQSN